MARERWYKGVPQTFLTSDGQENGIITIEDTHGFKVKSFVIIKSNTQPQKKYQVKRILNKNEMIIGEVNTKISQKNDMSAYLVSENATIEMPEQERPDIPPADYERAVYEEEPTVAKRNYLVDKYGDGYTVKNPVPSRLSDGENWAGYVLDALKVYVNNEIPIDVNVPEQDYDTFHRTRQSTPTTLWEFSNRYDINFNRYWDTSIVGGGSIVHDPGLVSRVFTNGLNAGDRLELRTRRYFQYYKGKSQLIYLTGNFQGGQIGVKKQFGYFDEENGLYISIEDNIKYFNIRSNVSGSVIENKIPQLEWNLDKMDGTGDSGIEIDFSKQQLMIIDFSWLGTNIARFGFIINGDIYYAHKQNHSNELNIPYMQSGSLPISYVLENTTNQVIGPTMGITCGSVISEGGDIKEGIVNVYDSGTSTTNVNVTPAILAGFRLNPLYNKTSAKTLLLDILATSGNSEIYYQIIYNPVITNPVWAETYAGNMQYLQNYNNFSEGEVIDSGYVTVGDRTSIAELQSDLYFGKSITGESDPIIIVVRTLNSNANALYSLKWREFI